MDAPPFKVTPAKRQEVQQLKACGMSEDDIARAIGCSTPTLRKHFAEELRTGHAKKRAEVIRMLFKTAKAGNVSAQRKLVDLTAAAADFPPPNQADDADGARKPAKGKKEAAQEAAVNAAKGTDWDDLLTDGPMN